MGDSELIFGVLSRPREAAVAIVSYVNHRNPNVSLLALTVMLHTTRGVRG